jgi:transcriptional regulator with XRE-family HTH domain
MFDNLGRALYLIRDLRGLSQAEVARRAGIGKSQLSKYESGKELPKLESLRKVLKVLEIGPFEIFYTMHLIDLQALKLDLTQEAKLQALPPLVFPIQGVIGDSTEEAFQRLFKEVISLYHSVFIDKLKELPRKH